MSTQVQRTEASESKFRELILYIASASANDPRFGAVKLNKLLYHADMIAYVLNGEPITGAEYIRLPQGPGPRLLLPIRDAMVEAGDIRIDERSPYEGAYPLQRVTPLRDAELSVFAPEELRIVDIVLQMFRQMTGRDLSDITHEGLPWRIASEKGTIPYEAVFLAECEVDDQDVVRAKELSEQYGWRV